VCVCMCVDICHGQKFIYEIVSSHTNGLI